jgi:hypothetical protein
VLRWGLLHLLVMMLLFEGILASRAWILVVLLD